MKTFYATFMLKQAFKHKYVQIHAENMEAARRCMFDHFGGQFMTVYNQDAFEEQVTAYGLSRFCIIEVKICDHNDSATYELIAVK
jgi:hypothetical protein